MLSNLDENLSAYVRKKVTNMDVEKRKRGRPTRRGRDCLQEDHVATGVDEKEDVIADCNFSTMSEFFLL